MELSPIYEALKRCLYPAIEPLIYTNYRGFNASSPFQRVAQDRIANPCHRGAPFVSLCEPPAAQQNIPAPLLLADWHSFSLVFASHRENMGKLLDSV